MGQTKQEAFITEQKFVYYKVLAIIKCHKDIASYF